MNEQELLSLAYASFNNRDADGALSTMTEDVSWPKASEGGRVVGKQAIREYWSRQWEEFDPYVTMRDTTDRKDGTTEVTVHQLVKSRGGEVISDSVVLHVYTFEGGLIRSMEVG